MSSLEVWTATIRALDALGPSLSTSTSPEAGNVSAPTASSSSPSLIAKRRDVNRRHELLLRALELHSKEEKHLSVLEKRAQNAKLAINRLPVELLLMVFVEMVALLGEIYDENELSLQHSNPLHPLSLAGVCHHWMHIVYSPTGARLWTRLACQTVIRNVLSDARRFHTWLPRSRPFTFDVSLSDFTSEDDTVRPVIDALLPHASRCRSLGVSGFWYQELLCPLDLNNRWTSLVHLTVGMIDVRSRGEDDSEQRPPPFFLELPDESRHLETLTIETWFSPSIQSITSSLNAPSVCVGIKRLALRGVLFRFDRLVWLLRFFPNLISFEFRSEEEVYFQNNPLPQDTSLVPLPHLETIEFGFIRPVGLVLKALDLPNLKVLRVEGGDGLEPSELAPPLSRLEVLELVDPDVDSHDLAKSVCSPRALRSIHYYQRAEELQVGLDQLVEFARSPPSGSEAEMTPADEHANKDRRRRLDLFIGPSSAQPGDVPEASSEAKDFVLQLDALGMMREARERAYGCMFRIQVSPRLVEWWPAVAEVVQRHPDFLELGELCSFETAWWKRS